MDERIFTQPDTYPAGLRVREAKPFQWKTTFLPVSDEYQAMVIYTGEKPGLRVRFCSWVTGGRCVRINQENDNGQN